MIWRAKSDFHSTSPSTTSKGFTHVGTSTQIPKTLVCRVQSLMKDKRIGIDVNSRIRGLDELVNQKKRKLSER